MASEGEAKKAIYIPTRKEVLEYYSNDFILDQMLRNSKSREIAGALPDGRYDSRPNILQYRQDIIRMVEKGITSFHFSVERWSSPMALSTEQENYDKLRTGWDLVLDVDAKHGIEDAKAAVIMILGMLKNHRISNYTVKFSGSRGFHIILPWDMFPQEMDFQSLAVRYPEIPRVLAGFIRKEIREELLNYLKRHHKDFHGKNPFELVEVEKDWGNRHMFRAPYSFNEKTWLVSLPVGDVKNFVFQDATPEKALNVAGKKDIFVAEKNEAEALLLSAMDWYATVRKEKPKKTVVRKRPERKILEEKFPPCMRLVLAGMKDGRKRSIFTLISFLRMMNWTPEEIEERVVKWNNDNEKPLPASIVIGQLRYHLRRQQIPPANCDVGMYYKDMGICRPDAFCGGAKKTVKNPINYPYRKMKKDRKESYKKWRGYTCMCGESFETKRGLAQHKGRVH